MARRQSDAIVDRLVEPNRFGALALGLGTVALEIIQERPKRSFAVILVRLDGPGSDRRGPNSNRGWVNLASRPAG